MHEDSLHSVYGQWWKREWKREKTHRQTEAVGENFPPCTYTHILYIHILTYVHAQTVLMSGLACWGGGATGFYEQERYSCILVLFWGE